MGALAGPAGAESGHQAPWQERHGSCSLPRAQVIGTSPWGRSRRPCLGREDSDSITFGLLSRRGKIFPSPEAILDFISRPLPPTMISLEAAKGAGERVSVWASQKSPSGRVE